MKRLLLVSCILALGWSVNAQHYAPMSKQLKNIAIPDMKSVREAVNPVEQTANPYVRSGRVINEFEIGSTFYDLQSNTSAPANRFYRYADGTMAAVWTRGMNTGGYADRGTGYNYFNGADWGAKPTARIETQRTGWPTYAPQGTGELVIAHHNTAGLVVSRRDTRGSGPWSEYILAGPASAVDISWPRMVSSGDDHMNIHMLSMTYVAYEGLDLAMLYYRSTDGGQTWDKQHQILPGMASDEYTGFSGDTYSWADPRGDTIAFIVCDNWTDMFIMKSPDNGENWEKIMVWENPYPMWNGTEPTDTFYCPDGAAHLAFDRDGKLHVAFGVNRAMMEEGATGPSWFPFVDGVGYWNEDMPAWLGGDVDALNPDILFESGNLVGWMQDLNNNGQIDLVGTDVSNIGLYYVSPSSMPQITVDENNQVFLVYSGLTEGYDNGSQQYRHMWARTSPDAGTTWGDFTDLTGDILHLLDECVFPTIANSTNDQIHLIYQADNEPGLALRGDNDAPSENVYYQLSVDKGDIVGAGNKPSSSFELSQNYPNPFTGESVINLTLSKSSMVSLEVNDLTGRVVYALPAAKLNAGVNMLTISANNLKTGVYVYSVIINGERITRKMMVE
ncbi:MAG: T9SS type A sorting domain-containing protein [Bacteroidales bacterium]|nr:T9SS type A sorting domain-containing protein [Bacteroidales bacterium]